MKVTNEPGRKRTRKVRRIASWTIAATFIVLVVGIGGCEARKAYYDRSVRTLCEENGGITVFERVPIPRDVYVDLDIGNKGISALPGEFEQKRSVPVYQKRLERTSLKEGRPRIARHEIVIVRRADHKIVGLLVVYSRAGGDFPFPLSEPSYFQCPIQAGNLAESVLQIVGDGK